MKTNDSHAGFGSGRRKIAGSGYTARTQPDGSVVEVDSRNRWKPYRVPKVGERVSGLVPNEFGCYTSGEVVRVYTDHALGMKFIRLKDLRGRPVPPGGTDSFIYERFGWVPVADLSPAQVACRQGKEDLPEGAAKAKPVPAKPDAVAWAIKVLGWIAEGEAYEGVFRCSACGWTGLEAPPSFPGHEDNDECSCPSCGDRPLGTVEEQELAREARQGLLGAFKDAKEA